MEKKPQNPDIERLIQEGLDAPEKPQWPPPPPGQSESERGDLPLEPTLFEKRTEAEKRQDLMKADQERKRREAAKPELALITRKEQTPRPAGGYDDLRTKLKSDGIDDRRLVDFLRTTAEKLTATDPKLAAEMVRLGMETPNESEDAAYVMSGLNQAIERLTEGYRFDKLNQMRQLIAAHESPMSFEDLLREKLTQSAQDALKRVKQRAQIKTTKTPPTPPPADAPLPPIRSLRMGVEPPNGWRERLSLAWRKLTGR